MGQQKGALKIKGTLGDITFAKTKNGFIVKEKSEVSAEMRATSTKFDKLRSQESEFGRSGKAVKLLRKTFDDQLKLCKDAVLSQRLQKAMLYVVKSDPLHDRGLRTPEAGDLSTLEGFEFNNDASWSRSIGVPFTHEIDRVTGKCKISIPSFIPQQRISAPQGSTHFRIVSAASEINFAAGTDNCKGANSALTPIDFTATPAINFTLNLTPDSTGNIFLILGIQFAEVVNTFEHYDTGGQFNAMMIVAIDRA